MRFKILPNRLRKQQNNIINKNERLATNLVKPEPSSIFDKSYRHLTTFDSSKLVPIFVDECLPGDIFNIDVSTLIRLSLPNAATMENPVYDISFFFVPNRILWDGWIYFMGENKSAGYQKDYKTVPIIDYSDITDYEKITYGENDLASYLGIPINVDMSKIQVPINSLFFKAYGKIWNDYFRDENLQSEIDISNNNNNDDNVSISKLIQDVTNNNSVDFFNSYNVSVQAGFGLAPVSRLADYFSTCLPYPQKGDSVTIDTLPLKNLQVNLNQNLPLVDGVGDAIPLKLYNDDGTAYAPPTNSTNQLSSLGVAGNLTPVSTQGQVYGINNQYFTQSLPTNGSGSANLKLAVSKTNNIADIVSTEPFNYSINDLRLALAIQHMRELDARGGSRYIEILYNHFGVQTSDSRLDRAEMIGGFRDNINISNVVQSAPGNSSSATEQLGSLGGVSVTGGRNPRTIRYAVKEHGIIMGFITVRPQINYSQGLDKKFTRIEKLDYYDPALANIGEQPVKKFELFLSDAGDGAVNTNNDIFGYNEAWADYRYSQNKLSGYISVNSNLSLANLYTYTENYANAPVLGSQWMFPDKTIIGNTLLLTGSDSNKNTEFIHQFMGDFYFNSIVERKLPVYSIPGLKRI